MLVCVVPARTSRPGKSVSHTVWFQFWGGGGSINIRNHSSSSFIIIIHHHQILAHIQKRKRERETNPGDRNPKSPPVNQSINQSPLVERARERAPTQSRQPPRLPVVPTIWKATPAPARTTLVSQIGGEMHVRVSFPVSFLTTVPPARYAMLARDEKKKKKKREQRARQASKETTLRPRDNQADRGASMVLLFFSILLHHLACAFSLFSATEPPGLGEVSWCVPGNRSVRRRRRTTLQRRPRRGGRIETEKEAHMHTCIFCTAHRHCRHLPPCTIARDSPCKRKLLFSSSPPPSPCSRFSPFGQSVQKSKGSITSPFAYREAVFVESAPPSPENLECLSASW